MELLSELAARAALDAVPEVMWRPFDRADLPTIASFYAECERHDGNPERTSLADLREYWDAPWSVPTEDTLVGRDGDGEIVAVAWSRCHRAVTAQREVQLGGAVRPTRRTEGIGSAVLQWELAHGAAWDATTRHDEYGSLVLRLMAPADQLDVRDLALRHGLTAERYFFEMSRRLDTTIPARRADGVRLSDWDPARNSETHQVINESFGDHWGHTDTTAETWQETLESHRFRPSWTVLAIDRNTGRVVGVALNVAWEQDWAEQGYTEGYTEQLGVLASHRNRGVAAALLTESMRRFAASGMDAAGLGVDTANPTGALRLYEKLGYRQTADTCLYQVTGPCT